MPVDPPVDPAHPDREDPDRVNPVPVDHPVDHPDGLDPDGLDPADETHLLAQVAGLLADMDRTPESVLDAARSLHDWHDIDAHLAELVAEPVQTRGDATAYTFVVGTVQLRAEVEPAGYRRRRLAVVAADEQGDATAERISVQFPDGTTRALEPDRFGDFVAEVPAGAVRALAAVGATRVTTPWFVV